MDMINKIINLLGANIVIFFPIMIMIFTLLILKIPCIKRLIDTKNCVDKQLKPEENDPMQKRRVKRERLNQTLRELRAEITDLSSAIEDIKQGKSTVKAMAEYINKTAQDIKKLFLEINQLNENFHSDTIRHINNYWEQMKYNPVITDPTQSMVPQDQLHHLSMLETKAKKMILAIGFLTIPHRVNTWLQQSRPGYYLPFHLLFEDDLPSPEDRQKVLNTIAWAPEAVKSGIVNIESGLIYRYEPERSAQYCSFVVQLLIFYCLTVGVWFFGKNADYYFEIKNLTSKDLLVSWIAVLIGMFIHIIIDKFKRSQETGLPQIVATGDWLIYLSAHKGDILLKLITALFGLFGFIFSSGNITVISSFLVGYSLDSFIGVFSSSLEQKAEAQYSAFNKKISG